MTAMFFGAMARHPLTNSGREARERYRDSMNPTFNCIPWPTPFFVLSSELYLIETRITPDTVVFKSEFYNAQRTIYTDGRAHPPNGQLTNQGHSIGRWEGRALVVDTTLFTEHRSPTPNLGIPSGKNKHVVERFSLAEDGKRVTVDLRVEDAEFLAEPFIAQAVWHYTPQRRMIPVGCDPKVVRRSLQ